MKVLLILLLFSLEIFGYEDNPLLLRAQATVFPKIILLDKDIKSKVLDNKISLNIIHNEEETESAQYLKEMIDKKYKGALGLYDFVVELTNITKDEDIKDSTSYYFLNLIEESKKNILSKAKERNKICFGYSNDDFNKGILISLLLKEKTYIYLNKEVLSEYNMKFVPIFYKIVKVQ